MPLRPATFAPYPPTDKRAAARERYFRALEEARKAKEAYADTLSDEEQKKDNTSKSVETQPAHHDDSRPELRVTTSTASPAPPAPPAACAFQDWFKASMGVPSAFAACEQSTAPAHPITSNETTMPAPIISPQQPSTERSDPATRRREALSVAALSRETDEKASPHQRTSPYHEDQRSLAASSPSSRYHNDRIDDPPVTPTYRQPRPDSLPPLPAALARPIPRVPSPTIHPSHPILSATSGGFPRRPTQLPPLPPPRNDWERERSESRSQSRSHSRSRSRSPGRILPPLRTHGADTRLPPIRSAFDPPLARPALPSAVSAPYPRMREERDAWERPSSLPPTASGRGLPLLAAAAAAARDEERRSASGSTTSTSTLSVGVKRHERDWDREREWERTHSAPFPPSSPSESRSSLYSAPPNVAPAPPARTGVFACLSSFFKTGCESVMPAPMDGLDDDLPVATTGKGKGKGKAVKNNEKPAKGTKRKRAGSTSSSSTTAAPATATSASTSSSVQGRPASCKPLPQIAQLPQLPLPTPRARPPSPVPQRIPRFVCAGECDSKPSTKEPASPTMANADAQPDPLAEIKSLGAALDEMRRQFVFPATRELEFEGAIWETVEAKVKLESEDSPSPPPPAQSGEQHVRLPVVPRNLTVHAYAHALHKLMGKLESLPSARARGVREARKGVVARVKAELDELDERVQVAGREWRATRDGTEAR